MGFVVVGNHDGVCQSLRDDLVPAVFDREYYLETHFLVLVTTIACDAHGKFNLHSSRLRGPIPGFVAGCLSRNFDPFLDFIGVEDDDSPLFVFLEELFFLWLFLLLPRSPFPLTLNAARANLDLTAIQRLVLIIS